MLPTPSALPVVAMSAMSTRVRDGLSHHRNSAKLCTFENVPLINTIDDDGESLRMKTELGALGFCSSRFTAVAADYGSLSDRLGFFMNSLRNIRSRSLQRYSLTMMKRFFDGFQVPTLRETWAISRFIEFDEDVRVKRCADMGMPVP